MKLFKTTLFATSLLMAGYALGPWMNSSTPSLPHTAGKSLTDTYHLGWCSRTNSLFT